MFRKLSQEECAGFCRGELVTLGFSNNTGVFKAVHSTEAKTFVVDGFILYRPELSREQIRKFNKIKKQKRARTGRR